MELNKEFKEVAEGIQAKFDEFKAANDKHIEAITAEKSALEGKVDKLNEQINEFEDFKKQLELEQKQKNRPGVSDSAAREYKEGFLKFMRKGDASAIETKAVNTTTDSDGGFAVPEELDRQILEIERDMSPMRSVCNTISVSTPDYKKLVNLGGAASGWVGEDSARPETGSPSLAQISAFMGEIYANPSATQQSLDDVFFNAEAWLTAEVAQEFSEKEGQAFLSGDGTNKPKGLLAYTLAATADDSRAFGTIQNKVAASATALDADELLDLVYALKAGYRRNASWMMNKLTIAEARKLKDTTGAYLWQPSLQAGQPSTLMGYAVNENDDMATLAANANGVLFGDFRRAYTIVDRIGTRVLRDPYTNKPYVHFYTTRRTGGMLTDSNAVKVLTMAAA